MLTPHAEYLRLGVSDGERQKNYRAMFDAHTDNALLNDIQLSLNRGLVLGTDRFKDQVEINLGRRARPGFAGRPAQK